MFYEFLSSLQISLVSSERFVDVKILSKCLKVS